MKHYILVSCIVSLFAICEGCATSKNSSPVYSDDKEAQAVMDVNQFDTIANHPNEYVKQKVKLAGRIDVLKSTQEGYEVLAKWLPYPDKQALNQGPQDPKIDPRRQFAVHFKGKRDRVFVTSRGNKFILEGTVKGTQGTLVNTFGLEKDLLYINAICVHVWETGIDEIMTSPDTKNDHRSKTFCADR